MSLSKLQKLDASAMDKCILPLLTAWRHGWRIKYIIIVLVGDPDLHCEMVLSIPLHMQNIHFFPVVMSTIPKLKHKRSDIEANYRNETKTFWCVPKKEVEHFYFVQKLWIKIITFLCAPEPNKIEIGTFLYSLEHLNQNQNILMCSRIF